MRLLLALAISFAIAPPALACGAVVGLHAYADAGHRGREWHFRPGEVPDLGETEVGDAIDSFYLDGGYGATLCDGAWGEGDCETLRGPLNVRDLDGRIRYVKVWRNEDPESPGRDADPGRD